jgi:hypothetical protein
LRPRGVDVDVVQVVVRVVRCDCRCRWRCRCGDTIVVRCLSVVIRELSSDDRYYGVEVGRCRVWRRPSLFAARWVGRRKVVVVVSRSGGGVIVSCRCVEVVIEMHVTLERWMSGCQ